MKCICSKILNQISVNYQLYGGKYVKLEKLSTKTKVAVNVSKYYYPLFSKVFDHILYTAENEDEFKQKIQNELSTVIIDLRESIRNICEK